MEKNGRDRRELSRDQNEDRDTVPERSSLRLDLLTLDCLDGRSKAAKLAQKLIRGIVSDLGTEPSTAQAQLAQRAALLGAICEHLETRWLERRPCDLDHYARLVGRQRQCLEALGLERKSRNVTPGNGRDLQARIINAIRSAPHGD